MQGPNIIEELEKDIKEMTSFFDLAARPHVKTIIKNELDKLNATLKFEQNKIVHHTQEKENKPQKIQNIDDEMKYISITNYSWEQVDKTVKIYLLLDGIGEVGNENINCVFGNQSVDVVIKGYKNKNYRFSIKKLNDLIKSSDCKFLIKKNSINISLIKSEQKHWDTIQFKENLYKPENKEEEKKDDKEDPQASLMNMMKKLYNEGDDEMKKTIAQAWTKSQEEKDKMKV